MKTIKPIITIFSLILLALVLTACEPAAIEEKPTADDSKIFPKEVQIDESEKKDTQEITSPCIYKDGSCCRGEDGICQIMFVDCEEGKEPVIKGCDEECEAIFECTASAESKANTPADDIADSDEVPPAPVCQNLCGNEVCEEIVCLATGCPCAETVESCAQDCVVKKEKITEISVSARPIIGSHPKFSHNGKKIVYRRYKTGDDGLWIINIDGSDLKKLTSEVPGGEGTFDFGWSIDDKFIFYTYRGIELKIIDITTSEIRTLFIPGVKPGDVPKTLSILSPIVWLAQNQIAFILHEEVGKDTAFKVVVVDVDTGQIVEPAPEITLYFWYTKGSPEDSVIASVNTSGVVRELTPGGALSVPSVAPQATKIAYSNQEGIVAMNNNGSDAKVILPNLGGGAVPLFSPDGQRLLYSESKDDGHRILESDIYMVNIDGSDKGKLTDSGEKLATEPSWSADGKKIVFFYLGEADKQIAMLDVGASFVIKPEHQTGKQGEKLIYDLIIKNNDLIGEEPRDFMITGKAPLVPPKGWILQDCYAHMTPCMWEFAFYIYGAKRYPNGEERSNFTLDPQENPTIKMHVASKKNWPSGEYLQYSELHYGEPGGQDDFINLTEKPFVYEIISEAKWIPEGCERKENIINCPLYKIGK